LKTAQTERDRRQVSLTEALANLESVHAERDSARAEQQATALKLKSTSEALASTQEQLKTTQGGLEEKQASLTETARSLDATKADRARMAQELQALRAEVAQLKATAAALDEAAKKVELEKQAKIDELKRTYNKLLDEMKSEVSKGEITISQLKDKLTVNVLDEILFDSGSAQIKPNGLTVLQRVGAVLHNVTDKLIVIEGHTDNVRISSELAKKYPSNWELSTARATSVVRYLQDESKLNPERLSAAGYGLYHPVDSNDTPEGRQRNRRIEIKLSPVETTVAR